MYYIRAIQFILKGQREFTIKGYDKNSQKFNQQDTQVDLSSQHIIITGANSGIGYSAAYELIKKGAYVHLVCRNKERGEEALENLKKETNKDLISLHLCDMSDFDSIKNFVEEYQKLNVPLNALVHNAGTMNKDKQLTKQNIEYNFATNVAGVALMTEKFIPLMEKTSQTAEDKAKVVLVSSGGMYTQKLEFQDFNMNKQNFDGQVQYAKNKRQQVVLCEKWTQLYTQKTGIQFYSMHPGWVDTPVLPVAMPEFYKRYKNVLRQCYQGSDTIVWLLCINYKKIKSGEFYFDRESQKKHLCISLTGHNQNEVDEFYQNIQKIIN